MSNERINKQRRKTKETEINLTLNLDGSGETQLDTGIGFFDHMLDGFARHGFFDMKVQVKGDLIVDTHHSIEDTGIVLGKAIRYALKDKKGIKRYGSCILPMDETAEAVPGKGLVGAARTFSRQGSCRGSPLRPLCSSWSWPWHLF